MFIQTELTPNPASIKFLPGRDVSPDGARAFDDADQAQSSPLARDLFDIAGVNAVFFGPDFVTVTKTEAIDWDHLKPAVLAAIMDHFTSGAPVMADGVGGAGAAASGEADIDYDDDAQRVVGAIKELLDTRVRPAVAEDGGDIVFHRFEPDTGRVFLTMRGACAGCPSSTMTLKMGIERLLTHFVPEVTAVEAEL